jgi:hypothetical protein
MALRTSTTRAVALVLRFGQGLGDATPPAVYMLAAGGGHSVGVHVVDQPERIGVRHGSYRNSRKQAASRTAPQASVTGDHATAEGTSPRHICFGDFR